MSDMTDVQRKAARKVLAMFPTVKIEIARGAGMASLTPYLAADPDARGAPVSVTYGSTPPTTIERDLKTSCRVLVEPT